MPFMILILFKTFMSYLDKFQFTFVLANFKNMKNLTQKSIGSIVADDYRASKIFRKYDIDFCCKGNRTIQDVIGERNLPYDQIIAELNEILNKNDNQLPGFKAMSATELVDYILTHHHTYVREQLPVIAEYMDKVCSVHGHYHPELLEIASHFDEMAMNLSAHMAKEEMILFPYIKSMSRSKELNQPIQEAPFGSVDNPIRMMHHEHNEEGERFRKMRALSNDFTPPEEACNTYRVMYALLNEFEQDLHTHIHLENNILFPMAIEMERSK